MLVGYPPFASETPRETWYKIQNWRKFFCIPSDANVSIQAADLIRKLIADSKERLGINGVDEIKAHPFFAGINWNRLRYYSCKLDKESLPTSLKLKTLGILRTSILTRKKNLGSLPKER